MADRRGRVTRLPCNGVLRKPSSSNSESVIQQARAQMVYMGDGLFAYHEPETRPPLRHNAMTLCLSDETPKWQIRLAVGTHNTAVRGHSTSFPLSHSMLEDKPREDRCRASFRLSFR